MDTTKAIDIRYIVSRLAPGAEFHWKGGEFGTYADIGGWRSPDIPKPTESEVYAEWDRYQTELCMYNNLLKALNTAVEGTDIYHIDNATLHTCVALLLMKANAITPDGKVKPFKDWL